eukprot:gene28768-34731_t
MCTKCLKEDLLFCAPIPPPKKKGKQKKKRNEENAASVTPAPTEIDSTEITNEAESVPQLPTLESIAITAPKVKILHLFHLPSQLCTPLIQASELPSLLVIDFCGSSLQSLILLDSMVMRLGCYDVVHILEPDEKELKELIILYSSADASIVLLTRSGRPPLASILQSILQHSARHKLLWLLVSATAEAKIDSSAVDCTPLRVEAGAGIGLNRRCARAVLHCVLDGGKAWQGSLDSYDNALHMMTDVAACRSPNGKLLEEVLLFLWLA